MLYSPGDIVEANFTNMKGEPATSLFIVVYNEALDAKTKHNKNLIVAKLTSNTYGLDMYSHRINHKAYGLSDSSAVRANKLNNIDVTSIFRIIGTLSKVDWGHVSKKFDAFKQETARQSKLNLGGNNHGKR
jgi:hypothetical protein